MKKISVLLASCEMFYSISAFCCDVLSVVVSDAGGGDGKLCQTEARTDNRFSALLSVCVTQIRSGRQL